MKSLHMLAFVLLIIGGLNVGLSALGYNVVDILLGSWPAAVTILYVLVGLAALYKLFTHNRHCKMCKA